MRWAIALLLFAGVTALCLLAAFGHVDNVVVHLFEHLEQHLTGPVVLTLTGIGSVVLILTLLAIASDHPTRAKRMLVAIAGLFLAAVIADSIEYLVAIL